MKVWEIRLNMAATLEPPAPAALLQGAVHRVAGAQRAPVAVLDLARHGCIQHSALGAGPDIRRDRLPGRPHGARFAAGRPWMNRLAVILAVTMALIASASPTLARADGQLDPSFGSGGTTMALAGGLPSVATGVALDPQGGIVAGGWVKVGSQHEFTVERFLDNGSVDSGFGSGGGFETAVIGPSGEDFATGVAVDSLGRVVLAGRSLNGAHYQFAVARFTPVGQLDSTFNGTGIEATTIGPGSAVGNAVAVDSQNRILVAGASSVGSVQAFTIVRYLPSGELDSSFGTGGTVAIPLVGSDVPEAMAIDPQGRIVLAGKVIGGNDDFVVARYLPNGEIDHSFGQGTGYVRTAPGSSDDSASGVAIDPQGRIVVAGTSTVNGVEELAIVRYQSDGSLDPSFGSGGVTIAPVGGAGFEANGLALDAQGRALVIGKAEFGSHSEFVLARFREDGLLDPGFGGGGIVTAAVGTGSASAEALTIDPAGRIVGAGWASNGDFALARFIDDSTPPAVAIDSGPADGSFTNDPTPTFGFSSPEASTSFLCGIGGAGTACSSPFTTPQLADGPHTFAVLGADPAGNRSAPATRTFTVDTRAPRLKIKGRSAFRTRARRGRARFKIAADEPATLSCRLDHRKPRPCGSKLKTPKLKRGKHLLWVTATDRAGNVAHAFRRFRIVAARRR
jgi:uncharacterized delta-60 repeat protein